MTLITNRGIASASLTSVGPEGGLSPTDVFPGEERISSGGQKTYYVNKKYTEKDIVLPKNVKKQTIWPAKGKSPLASLRMPMEKTFWIQTTSFFTSDNVQFDFDSC